MIVNKFNFSNGTITVGRSFQIKVVYILILIAFVFRLLTFMGMSEGDDLYYTLLARRFSEGNFAANFIFDIRWAVILPVSLLYKIFGVNDITSMAPTFMYGLTSVYFIYNIVKEETSEHIAIITTLLYSSFPVILIYGNFLQTAAALEFFTLAAVFCFQKGTSTTKMKWFIFGGLALGGMFLTRITGLFIAPLLSFYVIWKRGLNLKTVTWISAAALCSLVFPSIQAVTYYLIHGDFFHYFAISKNAVSFQNSMNDVDPKDAFFYIRTLFENKEFANWKMYGYNGSIFLTVSALYLFLIFTKKAGKEILFLIWYLTYFLFMSFAPTSISPYTTLIRNIRYSIVFTAPMCAFIASTIYKTFADRKYLNYLMVLFFIFNISSNFYFSYKNSESFKHRRHKQKSSVEFILENYPDEIIYLADKNVGRRIAYYSGYKNNNYKHISSLSHIKNPGIFLLMGPGAYSQTRFYMPKKKLLNIKKNPPEQLTLLKKLPYFNVYQAVP